VVLRGFSSDHSADVLLVLDGVPINLPIHGHIEGYNDWSLLGAAAVGSMRLLLGPASPLYGDFNFGGVVEVFSPSDLGRTDAAFAVSSFGDANGWVRTGRRNARSGYFASLDGGYTDGWRQNASSWLGTTNLRGWRQVGGGRLEGGLVLYGSDWRSPGFLSVDQFNADDLTPAVDTSDGGDAQRAIANARYSAPLGEATGLEVSGWVQGVRTHVFLNIPEDGEQRQQEELDRRVAFGTQAKLVWNVPAGEFTAGVAGRLDESRYDRYTTQLRQRDEAEILNDGSYLSGALFGRWRRTLAGKWILDLGARLDAIQYGSLDRQVAGAETERATTIQASPKLGARYLLSGSAALLASVSRGFRGAPGVITDPSVPPLGVWGAEVGAQFAPGPLELQVALFRLDVSNDRVQDPISLQVVSSGASYRQGVNAHVGWQLSRRLLLRAEGTWNDARIKGGHGESAAPALRAVVDSAVPVSRRLNHLEPPRPGDPVPGVARYNARLGAGVLVGARTNLAAWVRMTGPFTPIGEPAVRTSAFALLDLEGTLPLGHSGTVLDFAIQNVFNTRFPEIRSAGFINPGAPRALRLAVRYDLAP
jgi:outer membrane receptor for Fe3+-dicitrate